MESREYHGRQRLIPETHAEIEMTRIVLTTDGSRRSRTLKGTLVVRARVRPEATATWVGATAEMVYSSEVADRLLKQVFGDE